MTNQPDSAVMRALRNTAACYGIVRVLASAGAGQARADTPDVDQFVQDMRKVGVELSADDVATLYEYCEESRQTAFR